MKTNIPKIIFNYLVFLGVFYLLSKASLGPDLRVFALGFAGSLFVLSGDVILAADFLLAEFLATFDIKIVITSAIFAGVMLIGRVINNKLKLKAPIALSTFYFVTGCLAKVFINFGISRITNGVIFCLLSCGVFVASMVFVSAFIRRKSYLKFNLDEIACGLIVVMGLFCGLYKVNLYYVDLVRLFVPIMLLITCYCEMDTLSLCLGTICGVGVCLGGAGIEYISLFCVMAIMIKLFKSEIKLFSALSCLCVDVIFGLYFNVFEVYTLYSALATFVAGGVFLLLPKKLFDYIIINYSKPSAKTAYRNLINESSGEMSRRLLELSEIFFDIDVGFRKLVRGALPLEESKKLFVNELIEDCCKSCENYAECHRKFSKETQDTFAELADNGFEKGKIILLELPPFLTNKCNRINVLLPEINGLINKFKKNNEAITLENNSKVLIAEQLRGVSKLLYDLSKTAGEKLVFDTKKEVEITEELAYHDIICSEVAVYHKDKNNYRISMVVRKEDYHNDKLLQSVQKVCKQKLFISSVSPALISGLMVIGFSSAPKYDIVFGVAKSAKDNATLSGDNYSLLKLNNNKFLMAICDGMGSGKDANTMSDKAVSLIENFYRADFDSEIILSSINRLLNVRGGDNFSTIDICNIDLNSSLVDFVKMGAVSSFIKHRDTITKIESGALPIGVLDEVSPKITKTSLEAGDMVVLVSDGVIDSVGEDPLQEFILGSKSLAPQEVADNILKRAQNECLGVPIDDMTVLVGKVFKNI